MKYNIILIAFFLLLVGCGTSKDASVADAKFARKPITEVSTEQLSLEGMMIDAKKAEMIGHPDEAMRIYRSLLGKHPEYGAAHYELGMIMARMNRVDSAIYHCQRAVESDGANKWYRLLLAELYQRSGNGKELVANWEIIVRQNPDVLEYYYDLSNAYIMCENIPKAVEVLNRVERKIGVTEPISLQKHRLWDAVGKKDKAVKELEALSGTMPDNPRYNAMLAEYWMKSGNKDKAKSYYDKVIAQNPDDGYVNLSMAEFYQNNGDAEKAYLSLKKGFANADLSTPGKLQILGTIYSGEDFYGKYSKYAFDLLDDVMAASEDSLSYALFYGDVLMRQKKYAEAARQFELAISADSSQYEPWEMLLICESEIDDNEAKMLDYARRASKLFPLHSLPYYLQGFMACQHKDYAAAVEMFSKCEKLGFTNGYLEAETYALLAESLYELGEADKAFSYFDRYLKLHPDDAGMLNNYAYFLAESNRNLDKAEEMARRACQHEPRNATFLDTYAWVLHKLGKKEAREVMQKAMECSDGKSEVLKQHWEEISHD